MTDPSATLRECFNRRSGLATATVQVALAELERRARIEARRDAYLFAHHWRPHPARRVSHAIEGGSHWVGFYSIGKAPPIGHCADDYHTALERALDAAGAP